MHYFQTPSAFYIHNEDGLSSADTGTNLRVGVLNRTGSVVEVAAAGIQIMFPTIPHVGNVRQRYPIAKPDFEGNNIWRELMALKQLVMNSFSYQNLFSGSTKLRDTVKTLTLTMSRSNKIAEHSHTVRLTESEVKILSNPGNKVVVYTTYDMHHSHTLEIEYVENTGYVYRRCDRNPEGKLCGDDHSAILEEG